MLAHFSIIQRMAENHLDANEKVSKRPKLNMTTLNVVSRVPILKVRKLTPYAIIPTRSTPHSAGLDIYSAYDYEVKPNSKALVWTDIQMALPSRSYGRIAAKSGLWPHPNVILYEGVFDEGYCGNIRCVVFNLGNTPFYINKYDKVAQLIIEKIHYPEIVETDDLDNIVNRCGGCFHSTYAMLNLARINENSSPTEMKKEAE